MAADRTPTLGSALEEIGRLLRTGYGAIRIVYREGRPVVLEVTETHAHSELDALLGRQAPTEPES